MASEPHRRVYVDLIGDQLHVGHAELLERAAALGDELVVGLFGDAALATLGVQPVDPLDERRAVVAANRHVTRVVTDAPLVPGEALLEAEQISTVALVDAYGNDERASAFAELKQAGRGVDVPWDERAAIQARLDRAGTHARGARLDRIDARLEQLFGHQEAALEGLGALAAAQFSDPAVTRERKPDLAAWTRAVRGAVGEHLGVRTMTRHGPAGSRPWVTHTAAWAPAGSRVTLMGDYAESVAYALAHSHHVSVLRPGVSPGVGHVDGSHLPAGANAPALVSCAWGDLGTAAPPSDLTAITDSASAVYLLRRRNLLWHFADRIDDALLLEVELSPTDNSFLRSRDGDFYCSDAYVRSSLHFVRFMEVVNLLTLVDDLPRTTGACRQRVSRFTRRKDIAHVGKVRFLDGGPAERIRAPVGTPIRRIYLARKRMLSDDELAFARGERGAP